MTMVIIVNGETVPGQFVELELKRLEAHPDFKAISDPAERRRRLRAAAEDTAINRMLMAQAASRDKRPIPESDIAREYESHRRTNGAHAAPAHNPSAPVSISVSGTNIQRGCDISILPPSGPAQLFVTPDTVDTSVNPVVVPAIFLTSGSYQITVINPSKAQAEITIYVS